MGEDYRFPSAPSYECMSVCAVLAVYLSVCSCVYMCMCECVECVECGT